MPKFNFDKEAEETNEQFAAEIARLTTLKADEIESLFPRKIDKQQLVDLMTIVRSSASRNSRAAALERNISTLAGTVMRLLEVLV